jgi:hypothetical protein
VASCSCTTKRWGPTTPSLCAAGRAGIQLISGRYPERLGHGGSCWPPLLRRPRVPSSRSPVVPQPRSPVVSQPRRPAAPQPRRVAAPSCRSPVVSQPPQPRRLATPQPSLVHWYPRCAEDPAFAEDPGSYSCHNAPYEPYLPRKLHGVGLRVLKMRLVWELWLLMGARAGELADVARQVRCGPGINPRPPGPLRPAEYPGLSSGCILVAAHSGMDLRLTRAA